MLKCHAVLPEAAGSMAVDIGNIDAEKIRGMIKNRIHAT